MIRDFPCPGGCSRVSSALRKEGRNISVVFIYHGEDEKLMARVHQRMVSLHSQASHSTVKRRTRDTQRSIVITLLMHCMGRNHSCGPDSLLSLAQYLV